MVNAVGGLPRHVVGYRGRMLGGSWNGRNGSRDKKRRRLRRCYDDRLETKTKEKRDSVRAKGEAEPSRLRLSVEDPKFGSQLRSMAGFHSSPRPRPMDGTCA